MRGVCAIVLDKGRIFLSFASIRKKYLKFLGEETLFIRDDKDFCRCLGSNIGIIERSLVKAEKKYSLHIDEIFAELPFYLAKEKEVEERVVLPRRKKLSPSDIDSGKRYIEDKFVEWDECCIHHIILGYQAEGMASKEAPIGLVTNKIKLHSLLICLKDSFYKESEDIFYNIERNFSGFIAHKISLFSQGFSRYRGSQAVISIGGFDSYAQIMSAGGRIKEKQFGLGINNIIEGLSKQYTIRPELASELLDRYGTFKIVPYSKEITVKRSNTYLNISTKALSNFIKDYFGSKIRIILDYVLSELSSQENRDIVFAFIGPLSVKEGFYGYIKNLLPHQIKVPETKCRSSSFGCLRYAVYRPLEREYKQKQSLLEKAKSIYHEYF